MLDIVLLTPKKVLAINVFVFVAFYLAIQYAGIFESLVFNTRKVKRIDQDTRRVLDRQYFIQGYRPNENIFGEKWNYYDSRNLVNSIDKLVTNKIKRASISRRNHLLPNMNESMEFYGNMKRKKRINSSETLHFSFVGDSRIRQLFAMFLKLVPDYDRFVEPADLDITAQVLIPNEVVVYSKLQKLFASFYLRTLLWDDQDRDLTDFFLKWLQPNRQETENNNQLITPHPDVLIIGISVHHMVRRHKHNEKDYLRKLEELVPLLQRISKNCQIFWLNQYPTQEFFGVNNADNTEVHARKIWHYNKEANQILKKGGIPVWNSASPLVEEYIRSCLLNKRNDGKFKSYFECKDFIHPGVSALEDIVQILYNLVLS